MTGPAIHPRNVPASDADRSMAVQLLERAIGRGYIDLPQFSERSHRAVQARTRADLDLLLLDLPGLQLADRSADPATRPPAAPAALALRGYGSRRLTGAWTVPALITVEGWGAATRLDFTQARLSTRLVTVQFRSNLGGVVHLRVPPGTAVRFDGLDLRGCSVHDRQPPDRAAGPPPLTLALVGVKRYGSITISRPRSGGLRRWAIAFGFPLDDSRG